MSEQKLISKPQRSKRPNRLAFTLIEILVVVSILGILTAMLIPRLRAVTKERNIREAARVVGSMFSQASQRAVTDGVSGVLLQRNGNFTAADGYLFAATRMGLLRAVPNYTGDVEGSMSSPAPATNTFVGGVTIPLPLEQEALEIVQSGDRIRFGTSSVSYQIESVEEDGGGTNLMLGLTINDANNYLPDPSNAAFGMRTYVIERLPRLLRSSLVDLSAGHLIDLRFTGCLTTDLLGGAINVIDPTFPAPPGAEIAILFDDQGKFSQLIMKDGALSYIRIPQSPFFAFVAESELDATVNPLADPTSLWVSVSNASGVVNVGYNNPSGKAGFTPEDNSLVDLDNQFTNSRVDFNSIITAARSISTVGSAAQ